MDDRVENEAISMYRQGKITLRKAAEIKGIPLREMIEILENKVVEIRVGRIKMNKPAVSNATPLIFLAK